TRRRSRIESGADHRQRGFGTGRPASGAAEFGRRIHSSNRKGAERLSAANIPTTQTAASSQPGLQSQSRTKMTATAFAQLLWRDLWVTLRNWQTFLAMTLIQPVFFLFVFGRLLPMLGQANAGYGVLFLPGIISLTTVLTAMQAVSMPLVIEFGFTKEIEDRLLSPLPVWLVAVQKLVFAAIRGLVAGAMIVPLGRLILGGGFAISMRYLWLMILVAVV